MAFSVKIRLEFLIAEYRRGVHFKQVVLLTGDRPLNSLREAEFIELGFQTEAEMVQYLWYNSSGLPEDIIRNASFVIAQGRIVNGQYRRPNTRDTIHQWLETYPLPSLESRVLAISRQPFVLYQDLVFYNVLQERVGLLQFETVGAAADPNESIAVHLDNLARCLYELRYHKRLHSQESTSAIFEMGSSTITPIHPCLSTTTYRRRSSAKSRSSN
jgi:hypothetical protein